MLFRQDRPQHADSLEGRTIVSKRSVTSADVRGRRVLCRSDLNVPFEGGTISDDTRIRSALPTVQWLRDQGARIVLCSHLGRPKGKVVEDLRLAPVAERLSRLLRQEVIAVPSITGAEAVQAVASMLDGDIVLLENLRFDPREEKNDPEFAAELATLADIYVNDAFGAAHRAHASTEGVAHLLPAYLGLLMQQEINTLGKLLTDPERPFAAIIGGAKVSDKIAVLHNLLARVDALLIGGGMANTFLLAQGKEVGTSLVEEDRVRTASNILETARQRGVDVLLPGDVVVARDIKANSGTVKSVAQISADEAIFDIGPDTAQRYADTISTQKTIFWNGPLGVTENPAFRMGTRVVAQAVANSAGFTIVGGGDSVGAIEDLGYTDRIDHISTGGGASLEFLEGRALPGIAAIPDEGEAG